MVNCLIYNSYVIMTIPDREQIYLSNEYPLQSRSGIINNSSDRSGFTKDRNPKLLRRVNNFLLVTLVIINSYIILVPLMPQILYASSLNSGKRQQLEQTIIEHQKNNQTSPSTSTPSHQNDSKPLSTKSNNLIIPAMVLDETIVENKNPYTALKQGVWRWPGGSTPDKGGNTVLAGHRFTYDDPRGTFYFLDKLKKDDNIGIVWNNYTYTYKVTEIKTVKTTQTDILGPTKYPTLTLYTCTPLWNPKDRLVVRAELQTGLAQ